MVREDNMKTFSIFNNNNLLHAHVKGRNYIHEHEGRKYALMSAAIFLAIIVAIAAIAMLAS